MSLPTGGARSVQATPNALETSHHILIRRAPISRGWPSHALLPPCRAYPDVVSSFKEAEAAEKRARRKPAGPRQTAEARGASQKRPGQERSSAVLGTLPENVSPAAQSEDSCLDMSNLRLTGRPYERTMSLAVATDTRERVRDKNWSVDSDGSCLSDEELEWDVPWRERREGVSRATTSGRAVCREPTKLEAGDGRGGQTSGKRGMTSRSGIAGAESTGRRSSQAGGEKSATPGGSLKVAGFCQWERG